MSYMRMRVSNLNNLCNRNRAVDLYLENPHTPNRMITVAKQIQLSPENAQLNC